MLGNVPKFEQAAFRTLGLHEAVLRLFDSPSDPARAYAAEYARTHARDLPVDELIRLADNDHAAVRRLAADLLRRATRARRSGWRRGDGSWSPGMGTSWPPRSSASTSAPGS